MVSIIVPVYNCEKYLNKCIESVLEQTYEQFELILVDDGSTDSSGKICDIYALKDKRIKVIHCKNGGASVARNKGIKVAQGQYILFLDSDDFWLDSTVLEKIINRLVKTNVDVLTFDFCKIYENGLKQDYFSGIEDMPIDIEKGERVSFISENDIWIASAWNKVVKKELFDKNRLFFTEGITAEDIGWCAKLALTATTFDYLNLKVVGYVQRKESVSNTLNDFKLKALKDNIFEVEKCISIASDEKKKILYPYLSYQIGVLLFNIACYGHIEKKEIDEIKRYMPYLKYSNNKRIKAVRVMSNILGVRNTLFLLKQYQKFVRRRRIK